MLLAQIQPSKELCHTKTWSTDLVLKFWNIFFCCCFRNIFSQDELFKTKPLLLTSQWSHKAVIFTAVVHRWFSRLKINGTMCSHVAHWSENIALTNIQYFIWCYHLGFLNRTERLHWVFLTVKNIKFRLASYISAVSK